MSPNQSLTEALFGIYATAGKEVEYTTEKGERRPYWANRFRQALQRAVDDGDVVGFVERLVTQPQPSRGFGYLADAGRLDLTVEALVVGEFRDQFSVDAVEAAQARLSEFGFQPKSAEPEQGPALFAPGSTFTVQVQVGDGGALTLRLA